MGKVYCVSYDLNKSGKDYKGLIEELKKSPNWMHHLDSTWFIATSETPIQVWNRINMHIDNDDNVIIIEVARNYYAFLPQEALNWLSYYIH